MSNKIPIVDLAPITLAPMVDTNWTETGNALIQALHGFGFVYIKNHGVDQEKITKSFMVSKGFFEQPVEQKLLYKLDKSPKGYHGQGYSVRDGLKVFEVRESFDFTGKIRKHPNDNGNFHQILQDLQNECSPLVKTIFKLLAIGLNLNDKNYFLERSKWLNDLDTPSFKTFRSLYYPPIPENVVIPQGEARVKEHSDFDFITLLFQDSIGGLEIKTKQGEWIPATPIFGTAIVNIGDLLEKWTMGFLPATKHRVLIPESEIKKRTSRQSIAYFIHPDSNTSVAPLKSSVIGDYSFKEFKAFEHTKEKLASVNSY